MKYYNEIINIIIKQPKSLYVLTDNRVWKLNLHNCESSTKKLVFIILNLTIILVIYIYKYIYIKLFIKLLFILIT